MGEKSFNVESMARLSKLSEGCRHCYVYRTDGKYGKDSSVVAKNRKIRFTLAA